MTISGELASGLTGELVGELVGELRRTRAKRSGWRVVVAKEDLKLLEAGRFQSEIFQAEIFQTEISPCFGIFIRFGFGFPMTAGHLDLSAALAERCARSDSCFPANC
ncbi:MAG: hypothetical protein ACFB9N_02925 [Geitlerinemataceae cyanobacterium]